MFPHEAWIRGDFSPVLIRSSGDLGDRRRVAAYPGFDGSLPERERLLTEAFYHAAVTFDQAAEERAYLRVLETHPQDATALHKLGAILRGRDDDAGAELLLERSLAGPNGLQAQYLSLIEVLLRQDRADSARSVEQAFERRYGVTAAEAAARGRN